ncbi:MAG: relaxase/mobilization nuclease domain-containing protein, partial [Gemmatimonadota bacterium]|nr:relaxase/mobilization nuclease domain-containing protein [Gemmatimonadota bacterium]
MLVRFLAHGTGSARGAANYLLGERDAAGKPREGVEVLRGDPNEVAALADTLEFEHRYTSGLIAWAPEDQPTDEQIEAVLDAFEKTAWAGLEPDRYAWAAVLHRERGGGAHVHVLAARCDLETGRSLNIAPPGWEKTFGPLRDAFNHEHGWARPDDPARARVEQPGHRAYIEATRLRAGLRLEASPRDLIRDYLLQRVEHGIVRNRADVVSALREAGLEVPRQGEHYLTALDPETGDRWRLKGGLYGENFDRERFDRPAAVAAGDRTQGDRGVDRERAEAARREL